MANHDDSVPPLHNHDDDLTTNMQKRRTPKDSSTLLPVTLDDTKSTFPRRRKRNIASPERGSVYMCGTTAVVSLVVGFVLVALVLYVGQSATGGALFTGKDDELSNVISHSSSDDRSSEPLPLAQFETVSQALKHSNLVGVYYAASWCPMSTPVTKLLTKHFASVPNLLYTGTARPQKHALAIVHVSSDASKTDMEKYAQRTNWIPVPFESDERTALKKHFQVCAKRELEELGIDRKFEIPTLIILDGKTHGVITMNGVGDLEEHGAKALDHWSELQQIVRSLESKFL